MELLMGQWSQQTSQPGWSTALVVPHCLRRVYPSSTDVCCSVGKLAKLRFRLRDADAALLPPADAGLAGGGSGSPQEIAWM